MKQFSIYPPAQSIKPKPGQILIAEPLLNDANFTRSVVLLCEHTEEGSVGFVLNQATDIKLGKLIEGLPMTGPSLHSGGPVQTDTLHLMHRKPGLLGGREVAPVVYWGGSFDDLYELTQQHTYTDEDIRLFLGYSGWGPGQLDAEIKEGTWLIADVTQSLIFETNNDELWKAAIKSLGKKYEYLTHIPTDPQLN